MNNLEFAFTLNTNGSNSLDAWASDTGRPPAVQIQESEVMQVASLCDTVQPALAGSGHISQDDAFELQLFELELNIRQQAHFLANNYQGFVREQWVMSKEDLAARFKSADAKLLALQRTKATLDKMAAELDAGQAVQPAGIMERAERDFSRQSLGASSGQLAQLAANNVPFERYHASEPEQRSLSVQPAPHVARESHVSQMRFERYHASEQEQRSLSVQPAPHVAHESHVSQPDGGDGGPPRLDRKRAWEDCGGAVAAAPTGAPAGRQRHEKSYRRNEICAFVAKCTNEYANQHGTAVDFYTMNAEILHSVKLQFPKCTTGPLNRCIPEELRKRLWTQKAADADLQITAEMMGARPRAQRRKNVANMKNQSRNP